MPSFAHKFSRGSFADTFMAQPGDRLSSVRLAWDAAIPSVQTFPASVAAALTTTGRTFSSIFRFDQASGSPTTVGSVALSAAGTQYFQRTMPMWDGSSMVATKGVEFAGGATTNYFVAGSTSDYDLSQSLTFVMCARVLRVAATRSLMGKQAGAATAGYRISLAGSSWAFSLLAHDGSTSAEAVAPSGATNEIDGGLNGSLGWWAFKLNLTARTVQVIGYRTAGTAVAMPAGAFTNAASWHLGGLPFYNDPETLQIAWLGVLTGSEAEAFDLTALNALDNIARVPTPIATYTRASVVALDVAYEAGFGLTVGSYHGSAQTTGLNQFPHGYHVNATRSPQRLGFWNGRGPSISGGNKRNNFTRTDDLSHADWVKPSLTATANAADGPQRFRSAAQLTATAGNATISQTITVTANKAQVHSFYVRRAAGVDVSLKLRGVDTAGPTTIVESSHTATSEWTRISLLTQSATATSVRYELEIVTNGATIYADCAQQEYGWLTPYQPQRSTLLDRAHAVYYIDNSSVRYWNPVAGAVRTTVVQYHDNMVEDAYVFSTTVSDEVTGNKDRFVLQTSDASGSTGTESEAFDVDVQHYDTSSTLWNWINSPNLDRTVERCYTYAWDTRTRLARFNGFGAIRPADSTAWDANGTGPASAPATVAAVMPKLHPGSRYTTDAGIEGIIEDLAIYGSAV